ncbi:MAG: hypothetical protein OHK0039_27810 [Bacteroidia bacterium]
MLLLGPMATAQTTFVLEQVPANTPPGDSIYLTGTFNQWQPGDPAYRLLRRGDGSLVLTLGTVSPPFSYKYTRGSWETVEADVLGNAVPNREQARGTTPLTVSGRVAGWEDLPAIRPRDTVELIVRQIPRNTPVDAALFVTGNFNSWQPGDPDYRLRLRADSSYGVRVPVFGDTLQFKFTRGHWETVEGRRSGRARFNRVHVRPASPLTVQIESWEDLSGTAINGYTAFWLIAAIQGILFIFAINTLETSIPPPNRLLSLLLLLLSLALIGRVAVYDRDIFHAEPKLLLLPDFIYFLYAPLFVRYIISLLHTRRQTPYRYVWHFVPFLLHLVGYLPLLLMDDYAFLNRNVDLSLRPVYELTGGLALLYNLCYWVYARRIVRAYEHDADNKYSSGSNLTFLRTILLLKAACLLLWVLAYVVGGYGRLAGLDLSLITDRLTDAIWIGFSLTVFLLGYFAMKEPEIFKLPDTAPDSTPDTTMPDVRPVSEPSYDPLLKQRVAQIMADEMPYLNPKLTLGDLAEMADTNLHELSRAINQGFGQNFNDFVNGYRVEAFKARVQEPAYRNHTFLAVAFMVGFNSKTAFNRSFKKLTGMTPGAFLQETQGEEA